MGMSPKKSVKGKNFEISFVSMYQKDNKLKTNENTGDKTGITGHKQKAGVSNDEPIVIINLGTYEVREDGSRKLPSGQETKSISNLNEIKPRRDRQEKFVNAQKEERENYKGIEI